MKLEHLLTAAQDQVGPYVNVDDWQAVTVQCSGDYEGTVYVEGTLDRSPATERWAVLGVVEPGTISSFPDLCLAGIRAVTADTVSGSVTLYVAGR